MGACISYFIGMENEMSKVVVELIGLETRAGRRS